MTTFVDLSHHNAIPNLSAYARAGHDRVVFKATEGTTFTDPTFSEYWAVAGLAGLKRGAYHFAHTATNGAAQADRLLTEIGSVALRPGDWLILDLEDENDMSRAAQFAVEFCSRMVAAGHYYGMIYTRANYAGPAGLTPSMLPPGWRFLWLSDYTGVTDVKMPVPPGWDSGRVVARQYTDRATVPGMNGPVDSSRVLNEWIEAGMTAAEVWADKIPVPGDIAEAYSASEYTAAEWLRGANYWANSADKAAAALATKLDALIAKVDKLALATGEPDAVRAVVRAELDATRLTSGTTQ